MRKSATTIAATAATIAAIASCSSPSDKSPDAAPFKTEGFHASQQWTPTNSLDLKSAEGTFVRAFFDSFARIREDEDTTVQSIPGLVTALDESSISAIDTVVRADRSETPSPLQVGVVTRAVTSARTVGRLTLVSVCEVRKNSKIRIGSDSLARMSQRTLSLLLEKTGSNPPPTDQSGPRNFPITNVFGSWKAQYPGAWDYGYDNKDVDNCDAFANSIPTEPFIDETDLVPAPPSPGWP